VLRRKDATPDGAQEMIRKILGAALTALAFVILASGATALAGQKEEAYEESLTVSKQIAAIHAKQSDADCFLTHVPGKSAPQALVDMLLAQCNLTDLQEYREDLSALKAKLNQRVVSLIREEIQAKRRYTKLIRISKGLPAEE
jgi:hypothetical protein